MRTLTYLAIGLIVFLITLPSFGFTDNLRIDFDEFELVSYTNAERIDGCWWNYDDSAPSEVIYKISFPEKAYNSVTFFNGFVSSESPAEYLQTFVGRNLGIWYPVESGSLGKPFKNFVRDTTIASYNNNQMYLRAVFRGQTAKVLGPDSYVSIVVPEPFSLLMLLPMASLLIRRR